VANNHKIHSYLQEMNKNFLSKYDILTVVGTPHTWIEDIVKYVDVNRNELSVLFHFDHMYLDYDENG